MGQVFLVAAGLSVIAAAVCGVLGFIVYPRQVRRKHGDKLPKRPTPAMQRQGLARALFIIAIAAAFVSAFFGLVLP